MPKMYNEYTSSIRDIIELKNALADSSLTESTNENTMTANQYYYAFENYITFSSDGTKRCGILFDLNGKIKNGDFLKVSVEIMTMEGDKASLIYNEGVIRNIVLNKMNSQDGFSLIYGDALVTDSTGTKDGKVFIGLEIGQVGKFRIRFPNVKHFAQIEYSTDKQKRKTKMFQIAKNTGSWVSEATNSYRFLDASTVSVVGNSLYLSFTKPFIQDVPQIFVQTNTTMGGYTVHFGYRGKDQVVLTVFLNGTQVAWSTIPDGAVINIMAIAGLYF